MTHPDLWTMWEVRATAGRLPELLAWAHQHADRTAQLFSSAEPDARLVIITRQAQLPQPPAQLIARDPYSWVFDRADRSSLGTPANHPADQGSLGAAANQPPDAGAGATPLPADRV